MPYVLGTNKTLEKILLVLYNSQFSNTPWLQEFGFTIIEKYIAGLSVSLSLSYHICVCVCVCVCPKHIFVKNSRRYEAANTGGCESLSIVYKYKKNAYHCRRAIKIFLVCRNSSSCLEDVVLLLLQSAKPTDFLIKIFCLKLVCRKICMHKFSFIDLRAFLTFTSVDLSSNS